MDAKQLAAIEARLAAITPGPWEACKGVSGDKPCPCAMVWAIEADVVVHMPDYDGDKVLTPDGMANNAAFIAAAPDTERDLLAEVKRLTAENAALQGVRQRRTRRERAGGGVRR